MDIKKQVCLLISLMLCSCAYTNENKELDNELILRDNSGIYSQLKIQNKKNISDIKSLDKKLNYPEQKGIWLSYIDLNELLYQKSEKEFENEFEKICQNCGSIGINTLYIHCRAFGDAFYPSSIFQKTKTFGKIDYDPFELMIKKAHEYKLSVHAWVNPFRCETKQYIDTSDSSLLITKWYLSGDDRLKYNSSDEHYWLDPGYDEVRQLICDGIKEIIENYDVDGIHFDDYFYPTDDEDFDKKAFIRSGADDLKKWRTQNIDNIVSAVYKTVKEYDNDIQFGISPQGNISNNYEHMYADVGKWCSEEGFIDYIVPQVYFGFENSILPFESCANEWNKLAINKNVRLIIGLAAYKIHSEDEYINNTDILSLQISHSRSLSNYSGYAFYNYISLFPKDTIKAETASKQIENIKKTGGK